MYIPAMVGLPAATSKRLANQRHAAEVMESIESALAARCGLSTLPAQIPESCIGIDSKSNGKAS